MALALLRRLASDFSRPARAAARVLSIIGVAWLVSGTLLFPRLLEWALRIYDVTPLFAPWLTVSAGLTLFTITMGGWLRSSAHEVLVLANAPGGSRAALAGVLFRLLLVVPAFTLLLGGMRYPSCSAIEALLAALVTVGTLISLGLAADLERAGAGGRKLLGRVVAIASVVLALVGGLGFFDVLHGGTTLDGVTVGHVAIAIAWPFTSITMRAAGEASWPGWLVLLACASTSLLLLLRARGDSVTLVGERWAMALELARVARQRLAQRGPRAATRGRPVFAGSGRGLASALAGRLAQKWEAISLGWAMVTGLLRRRGLVLVIAGGALSGIPFGLAVTALKRSPLSTLEAIVTFGLVSAAAGVLITCGAACTEVRGLLPLLRAWPRRWTATALGLSAGPALVLGLGAAPLILILLVVDPAARGNVATWLTVLAVMPSIGVLAQALAHVAYLGLDSQPALGVDDVAEGQSNGLTAAFYAFPVTMLSFFAAGGVGEYVSGVTSSAVAGIGAAVALTSLAAAVAVKLLAVTLPRCGP